MRTGDVKASEQNVYFGLETFILDKFKGLDNANLISFVEAPNHSIACPCKGSGDCDICVDGQVSFKRVLEILGTDDENLLTHVIWKLRTYSRFLHVSLDPKQNLAKLLSLRQIVFTAA